MPKHSTIAEAKGIHTWCLCLSFITLLMTPRAKLFNLLEILFLLKKGKPKSPQGWLRRLNDLEPHKEHAPSKHAPCSTPTQQQQTASFVWFLPF